MRPKPGSRWRRTSFSYRSQVYTYQLAHNNTHGVPTSAALENPFTCNDVGSHQAQYPCDEADDENWSRVVLTQRQASVQCVAADGSGCGSSGTNTLTSTWSYTYVLTDATAKECSDCLTDMYWGNNNDGDKLDFYNAHFMGFHFTNVTNPDGSVTEEEFYTTLGYGVATSYIAANDCASFSQICDLDPWTDPANALHGRVKNHWDFDTNGSTILKQTQYAYVVTCPPNGVPASAYNTNANFHYPGQNTSELDFNNPVAVCDIAPSQTQVWVRDGGGQGTANYTNTVYSYTYDGNGHISQSTTDTTANNASAGGTPHIVTRTQYEWNDTLTISSTSASGTYILQAPAITTTEDGSGTIKACTYDGYDGINPGNTGYHTTLTHGLLTREDRYATNCTPGSLSGLSSTQRAYDTSSNLLGVRDPDGQAGVPGHVNSAHCTISGVAYSACAQFDSLYSALPTVVYNALDQATTLNYTTDGANTNSPDATNGWGTWLTTSSDANGAVTAFGYDALGRLVALAKPDDTLASSPTTTYQYVVTCAATGAAEPCTALQSTQRLTSGGQTATSVTYYDGWGRPVETVTPQNSTTANLRTTVTYAVQYTMYDSAGRVSFQSDPYFVSQTYSLVPTVPPYFRPDTTQPGSSTQYDGLDRTVKAYDAYQHLTTTSYTEAQPAAGANVNDTAWYEATTVVDANGHQRTQLTDGFGRARYVETFTGSAAPYTLYGMQAQTYDWLGDVVRVTGPNPPPGPAGLSTSAQTTATYDLLGRKATLTDADLGSYGFPSYDANGNLRESVDPRGGASGTTWMGYDGLNRPVWRNTTNSQTGAYVTYTYDQTSGHGSGIGRLTTESFNSGQSLGAGSYSYTYDARGQQTALTVTLDSTHTFAFAFGYNDAGQPTSVQYSDGETLTYGYSSFGWLTSATLPGTTLATNLGYSGVGGAAMKPTSASVGNGTGGLYTFSASYDDDLRLASMSLAATSGGTTLYATSRTYDAVGNVASVNTTLAAGTDSQAFCYDEQNRLVWASSQSATGPCGASNTAGSLSAAAYTAMYAYDPLNRLTSATAQGSYTYGEPAHLHAATATSSGGYSAAYDLAGDLTCRAPNAAVTCAGGSPTGAVLGYDNERRLTSWQSAPSNPGATAGYAYDGEGHRVAQSVTAGGTTTTTYYIAGLEEQANVSGGTSTLTKYYSVPGVVSAVNVGGTLSFLASDGLGSVSEALSSTSAAATSQQLYGPYGGLRYATGSSGMPTAKGYTGQYADVASSGLDYYNARYYDPLIGQFASADSTADGLNRYGYVAGNPETATDPSGHRVCMGANCDGGGGGGSGDGGGGGGSGGGCASENQDCGGGGCHTNCGGGHGGSGHGGGGGSGGKPHGGCHGGCNAQNSDCDAQCRREQAARDDARQRADYWHGLVDAFAAALTISGILEKLSEAIREGRTRDAILFALGASAGNASALFVMEVTLWALFNQEAAHNLDWFTETNIIDWYSHTAFVTVALVSASMVGTGLSIGVAGASKGNPFLAAFGAGFVVGGFDAGVLLGEKTLTDAEMTQLADLQMDFIVAPVREP